MKIINEKVLNEYSTNDISKLQMRLFNLCIAEQMLIQYNPERIGQGYLEF